MSDYCVVVADAARARFFSLEPADVPELQSGPKLVEAKGLVNPEREVRGRDLYDSVKSGRNKAPGGPMHGYDDHRARHQVEFERRFARRIADETLRMIREGSALTVVLAAHGHMLGLLRKEMTAVARSGVALLESARDMTKMPPAEIHEWLARDKLVPPRRKPGAA